jgi:hypothetical protein
MSSLLVVVTILLLIVAILVLTIATATSSLVAKVAVLVVVVSVALVHLASSHLVLNILFDEVDNFIWDSEVFDRTAADVAFVHSPETVAILQSELG